MSFTITCPICGKRDVYEFRFGGQDRGPQPDQAGLSADEHFRYVQFCTTKPEPQKEWWYHLQGCGIWFTTWRNPADNRECSQPEAKNDQA